MKHDYDWRFDSRGGAREHVIMFGARSKAVVLVAGSALALASCTSPSEPSPTPESTVIVPDVPGRGPVDDATIELEFAVNEALDYDPYQKAARYHPDINQMVVTIWTLGDEFPRQRLEEMHERAQEVVGDANVVLHLVDRDGNIEQWPAD